MSKDVYYIRHDANAHTDPKIKNMKKVYGWEGYGWYWMIIEQMRTENDYKMEYSSLIFGSLAEDMKCDEIKAKKFIDDCITDFKLFTKNGTCFYSERLLRDMKNLEEIKSQRSLAGKISGIKRGTILDDEQMLNISSTRVEDVLNTSSTDDEAKPQNESKNEQMLNISSTRVELLNKEYKENILKNNNINVFNVYTENIGLITPIISEELKDIEKYYPLEWFIEATKIAAERNARNLKYITAILQRWSTQGYKSVKLGKQTEVFDRRKLYKRAN